MNSSYNRTVYKKLHQHIKKLWRRWVPEGPPRSIETRGGYMLRNAGPEPTVPPPKPSDYKARANRPDTQSRAR
jgi:hypothetical protein